MRILSFFHFHFIFSLLVSVIYLSMIYCSWLPWEVPTKAENDFNYFFTWKLYMRFSLFDSRPSSLKICTGNLAEQLVVWLTSEGKSQQVFKKSKMDCAREGIIRNVDISYFTLHNFDYLNKFNSVQAVFNWKSLVLFSSDCFTLWFRLHLKGPGVCPLWGGVAHQGGHLSLPGAAVPWLVRGCLLAHWTTGSDQTSP